MVKTVVSVIGARPQFVKAAIVSRALAKAGIMEHIVHTGQHYDNAMSDQLLSQLGISVAENLAVGSGTHAFQTAKMMIKFADYLETLDAYPDVIIVYGDTNSTIAAAMVASKTHIPIVHVEAGLRSYNRKMPEEVNRVVTDHLSSLLFCSSPIGVENLAKEGITNNVINVGDVMLDAFKVFSKEADAIVDNDLINELKNTPFILATIHRPSNTDSDGILKCIIEQMGSIESKVLWPVHPRILWKLDAMDLPDNIRCITPLSYFEMLRILNLSKAVLTDSGGLQKEAYWAKRKCVTLRPETEWVETLIGNWNCLANPAKEDVAALLNETPNTQHVPLYGDGRACEKIIKVLQKLF